MPSERLGSEPVEEAPKQMRKKRTTQDMLDENKGPGLLVTAGRTLLGFAIAAAILVGIFFAASAIEGDEREPLAPWNDRGAPQVAPATLADQ